MINSILLENIGTVDSFTADFNPRLNIIKSKHTDTIAFALGRITCNSPLCRLFPTYLRKTSRIVAQLENSTFDTNTAPDFLSLQSREEDNLCFYVNGRFKNHKVRLSEYKDFEYFLGKRQFSKNTDGACLSRTFRARLWEYIRNFKPQKLNPNKDYYIDITESGEFYVRRGNLTDLFLSATEETMFDFLCFLNILEFWEGFQQIKDFNHRPKPIVIIDLFAHTDEAMPKQFILNRLKKLNRQVFLLEKSDTEKEHL